MKEELHEHKQEPSNGYAAIAEEILKMAEEDQAMREAAIDDREKWDPSVDIKNTARMQEIVAQIGWPTKSKVGEAASHMAWLLLQHADKNPEFQRTCLELMEDAADGEAESTDVAYLRDRVQTKERGTQTYGTQFRRLPDGAFECWPIEDQEHLDERRAALGLEPFAEYQAHMQQKNEDLGAKRGKT